jgi:hypothetical protein
VIIEPAGDRGWSDALGAGVEVGPVLGVLLGEELEDLAVDPVDQDEPSSARRRLGRVDEDPPGRDGCAGPASPSWAEAWPTGNPTAAWPHQGVALVDVEIPARASW